MSVTIKDIARRAEVSTATVSRILGNYGYASEYTRRKVLQASEELNYRRNTVARSMVKKRTMTLGLIVTDLENPFFVRMVGAVEKNAREHGYSVLFSNTWESVENERQAVSTMIERQVDGLLIVPSGDNWNDDSQTARNPKTAGHLHDLSAMGFPFVFLDRNLDGIDADSVMVENRKVAAEATRWLLDEGYRNIALIIPDQRINTMVERYEGYVDAIARAGLSLDETRIVVGGHRGEDARQAVTTFLRSHDADAFLTLDYQMTIGTMAALCESGRARSDKPGLVAFDDLGLFARMVPFWAHTIVQPIDELARIATAKLIERIENPDSIGQHTEIRLTCRKLFHETGSADTVPESNRESAPSAASEGVSK